MFPLTGFFVFTALPAYPLCCDIDNSCEDGTSAWCCHGDYYCSSSDRFSGTECPDNFNVTASRPRVAVEAVCKLCEHTVSRCFSSEACATQVHDLSGEEGVEGFAIHLPYWSGDYVDCNQGADVCIACFPESACVGTSNRTKLSCATVRQSIAPPFPTRPLSFKFITSLCIPPLSIYRSLTRSHTHIHTLSHTLSLSCSPPFTLSIAAYQAYPCCNEQTLVSKRMQGYPRVPEIAMDELIAMENRRTFVRKGLSASTGETVGLCQGARLVVMVTSTQ
jgi:hypothetical protein